MEPKPQPIGPNPTCWDVHLPILGYGPQRRAKGSPNLGVVLCDRAPISWEDHRWVRHFGVTVFHGEATGNEKPSMTT